MIDLSVVIPTRNRLRLLRRALESVFNQSPVPSLECIVVDDGDPELADQVRSVVADFGAVYCTTGGGRGGALARNMGIDAAKGAMVAFLDDDDAWEPSKLSVQLSHMEKTGGLMSYTGITVVHPDGTRRYSFRLPRYSDQYRSIMKKNFIGTTSTVIVRRTLLNEAGGFDTALPALQDYDLYIRILRSNRVVWTDAPLTLYYAGEADDKVSESLDRFRTATAILSGKYRDDLLFPLLRRSFRSITLLKCVRSRRFLVEYLRSFLRGH